MGVADAGSRTAGYCLLGRPGRAALGASAEGLSVVSQTGPRVPRGNGDMGGVTIQIDLDVGARIATIHRNTCIH